MKSNCSSFEIICLTLDSMVSHISLDDSLNHQIANCLLFGFEDSRLKIVRLSCSSDLALGSSKLACRIWDEGISGFSDH